MCSSFEERSEAADIGELLKQDTVYCVFLSHKAGYSDI